jgi:hypothetical protein
MQSERVEKGGLTVGWMMKITEKCHDEKLEWERAEKSYFNGDGRDEIKIFSCNDLILHFIGAISLSRFRNCSEIIKCTDTHTRSQICTFYYKNNNNKKFYEVHCNEKFDCHGCKL